MANILPSGIDDTLGEATILTQGTDLLITGTNDYTTASYTGGDISIGTTNDGSYADVDATNANITFTVNATGKYLVSFVFSSSFTGTIGLSSNSVTSFRLTDGTNNSNSISSGALLPGLTLFVNGNTETISLNAIFTFSSTGSKTVKLQKKNITSSNIDSRQVLANSDSAITMYAMRVAD